MIPQAGRLLVLMLLGLGSASSLASHTSRCRCRPADPCWPSTAQWDELNKTLAGHLQALRPIASVCHDPAFDASACGTVSAMSNDSSWRSAQPGALQWTNWEDRLDKNESCYVDSDRDVPCGQGRISLFSALVQNAGDIRSAVRFARKHDLRLAIKNTGHCYLGRSSAPESLQIATHALDSIQFTDAFVPAGSPRSEGPAVTIGAGVQLKPLYDAVASRNVTVVAGLSHTVGAAGGYVQGGGHSPLGWWKGLASDNALEFSVVTAEGDLVIANGHRNPDLFWALRGGGGGTFGVVVNVTLRTFPEIPAIFSTFSMVTTNLSSFWEGLRIFHANLPSINDAGGSGYYFMNPAAADGNLSTTVFALVFANQSDVAYVNKTLEPTLKAFYGLFGESTVGYHSQVFPESKYLFAFALPGQSDAGGSTDRTASRLISRDFLSSPDGPAKLTEALVGINLLAPGTPFVGHIVAGGQVARASVDSAVNPAWRRTVTHIAMGVEFAINATLEERKYITGRATHQQLPLLRALEPGMGAYLNEADPDEVAFQQSFWGGNYERLSGIKKKWDPRGLFITRRGVGSEEWDEDGLCLV